MVANEKSSSETLTATELATGDSKISPTNFSNFYYTVPIYFGSGLTKLNLLFNSGTAETNLNISTCATCQGTLYNCAGCTMTGVNKSTSYYDGTMVSGERCREKTCPINNSSACIPTF